MGSSPTDSWIYNLKPKIIIFYGFWPKNCTSLSYFKEVSSHVPMGIFGKKFRDVNYQRKVIHFCGNGLMPHVMPWFTDTDGNCR